MKNIYIKFGKKSKKKINLFRSDFEGDLKLSFNLFSKNSNYQL